MRVTISTHIVGGGSVDGYSTDVKTEIVIDEPEGDVGSVVDIVAAVAGAAAHAFKQAETTRAELDAAVTS